jgi:NADH-quinone oxidoreductase subunit L
MYNLIGLVVLLPLIGSAINGLIGWRIKNEKVISIIGSGTVGVSFFISVLIFTEMLGRDTLARMEIVEYFSWIVAGGIDTAFAYQIDQLSILMTLVVTGVGFLIHVYSIGYMHGDPGFWRYFSYLNLFIFAMLNLVLADNFLLLFLGWEGVGLCSYLLIGFWYTKKFTGDAAKKAFVVNRIGDFGFLIGMFLIFITFDSLKFETVFTQASVMGIGEPVIFWITLMLFIGATGKSAQIPLFVWLPDAMAGPTPVSALIHAATMVTAGVYMVARSATLYALAPLTLEIVMLIGLVTAVVAATIALTQNDIKKVLAYSTVSQLGYMFLALGVGAFWVGIFHVYTHAFFKALLFLGSGAVIHAMHHEQDIRKMGGLGKYMPKTYKTFLIGAIAIAGIPPLAGFFSKDEILAYVWHDGSVVLWMFAALTAGLTAFYMFRLVSLTFWGNPRFKEHGDHAVHPHEAPATMTVPLIILAVLSIIGGWVGIPKALGGGLAIKQFLAPVFGRADVIMRLPEHGVHSIDYILIALSVAIAAAGIYLAVTWYLRKPQIPAALAKRYGGVYKVLSNKYYIDEIYDAVIVDPTVKGSRKLLWKGFDVGIIDGIVNGLAKLVEIISKYGRLVQVGVVQAYAVAFVFGIVFILFWLLFR